MGNSYKMGDLTPAQKRDDWLLDRTVKTFQKKQSWTVKNLLVANGRWQIVCRGMTPPGDTNERMPRFGHPFDYFRYYASCRSLERVAPRAVIFCHMCHMLAGGAPGFQAVAALTQCAHWFHKTLRFRCMAVLAISHCGTGTMFLVHGLP
jgi:hypothetical protein